MSGTPESCVRRDGDRLYYADFPVSDVMVYEHVLSGRWVVRAIPSRESLPRRERRFTNPEDVWAWLCALRLSGYEVPQKAFDGLRARIEGDGGAIG